MTPPSHRIRRLASLLLASLGVSLCLAGDAVASSNTLVLIPDLKLVVALIIFFVLLVLPLDVLLFRPIFAALDARRERITGTRDRAEKLDAEAEATLTRYENAVREVREEAEVARKAALSSARDVSQTETEGARADAESVLERARQEIAGEVETARATLRQQAETLAREAAMTVLGRPLT